MAREPKYSIRQEYLRKRAQAPVVKPSGRFIRERTINITTDRSPHSVTSINPDNLKPILPEMPYIPPA